MAEPAATGAGVAGTRFRRVEWFAELDSTNAYLLQRARDGAPDGLVVVADVQTAGRGRLGREWFAPSGASLLVSVLLRPSRPIDEWPLAGLAAGAAAVDSVTALCDLPAQLKWPNDVLVRGRKLAGVLAEAEPAHGALVVGMGLNLDWPESPAELESIATVVSLAGGRVVERTVLLDAWLARFDRWLFAIDHDATAAARLRWLQRARSATLGRPVRVERVGAATVVGTAVDIDERGHLVVRADDGARVAISVGDVVHARNASAT